MSSPKGQEPEKALLGSPKLLLILLILYSLTAAVLLLAWHNFFRVSELLWYGCFLGSSLALGWLAGKRPRSRWYAPAVPAALGWLLYPMPAAYDLFRVIRLPLPWEKLPLLCPAADMGTMPLRFLVFGRIGKTERK